MIDESFENRPDGITVNHLSYPNIGRQHVNARFVCMASNTNLTPPNNKVVILDVNRKYLFLQFIGNDSHTDSWTVGWIRMVNHYLNRNNSQSIGNKTKSQVETAIRTFIK